MNEAVSVYLKVQGNINAEAEREKLKKKMEEIQRYVISAKSKVILHLIKKKK